METREVIINKLSRKRKNQKLTPPGPPFEEVLDASQHKFLDYLVFESPRLMKKYGGIIRLASDQYLIADPEAFKHILKTNPNNYSKKNMNYERIKLLLGDGLLTREGPSWVHHRTLINPFYERQRLQIYADAITQTTEQFLNTWKNKKSINIVQEMSYLTLTISLLIYCNHKGTEAELKLLCNLLVKGGEHVSYGIFPNPWIPTFGNLQFFNLVRKTNAFLQKLIIQRRQQAATQHSEDLIDILLSSKKTTDIELSDQDIRDEILTMLFASHETTSCALIWCFYLLSKHPQYWELLKTELTTILKGAAPSFDNWSSLPLTKAIFLESLRLFPSIWCLPRISLEDDQIGEYHIPKDTSLMLNIFALHRNPKYWENPNHFYPERFMNSESPFSLHPGVEDKRTPFSFLPFSLGPRTCIGSQLAMMEGVMLLAMIAQKYQLKLSKKNKIYNPEPYLSLRPPHKMKMDLFIE